MVLDRTAGSRFARDMARIPMATVAVAATAMLSAWGIAAHAPRTRMVMAEVSQGERVVLRASTSDDGHPDVDEVWGYLRGMTLEPTADFAALGVDEKSAEFTMRGEPFEGGDGSSPRRPTLRLEIDYGGRAQLRELRLLRATTDAGKAGWRIDPAELDRHFSGRWIRRVEAGLLEKPKRSK